VEDGTRLDGSLISNCPIEVNGKIEGEVTAPSLRINDTGSVRGKVKVDEIESKGEMSGEFEADVVRLAGVLRDDSILRAKSLEVKLASPNDPNPIMFGACSLEVGDIPDKEAVIRASRDGVSLRPGPGPALRASAPPAESVASVSEELVSDAPADLGESRSSKRKAAASAKRP
jgi:hypothetical protein